MTCAPAFACDARDQKPDRAAAKDDRLVPGLKPRASDIVNRDGGRLGEGGSTEVEPRRQSHESRCGNRPQFLQGSGGIDADKGEVLTDVVVARVAGRACAVPAEGHHRHGVSGCPALNALPHRLDGAGHLVSEDQRPRHPLVHMPVVDVEVGSAQADESHPDPNFTILGLDGFDLVSLDGALGDVGGTARHEHSSRLGHGFENPLANIIRML